MPEDKTTKKGDELEKKLAGLRQMEEEDKDKVLAKSLNLPYSDLKSAPIDTDALSVLNEEEARSVNMAVIFRKDSKLVVAVLDPNNPATQNVISRLKTDHEVGIIVTNWHSLQNVFK